MRKNKPRHEREHRTEGTTKGLTVGVFKDLSDITSNFVIFPVTFLPWILIDWL